MGTGLEMNRNLSIQLSSSSTMLAVLAGALATAIFIIDTVAPLDVALAVLYVAVVLIGARFLQRRGVLLVALGCIILAVISHAFSLHGHSPEIALVNLLIGVGAIAITTYLALLNQASEMASRERASLLDVAHDAIFVRALDDTIIYWNKGAEERYGWPSKQAFGKLSHRLLQTVFPAPLETIKDELVRTGRWEGELVHTKRDGSTVVVASRWSLQMDERGQPLAILETNNDITQQKHADAELRASVRKYHNIFQTVGVSIWEEDFSAVKTAIDTLRAQGVNDLPRYLAEHPEFTRQAIALVKVLDVNDATLQLFGAQTKDELLTSWNQLILPETEAVFEQELIALADGQTSFAAETVMQSLQGERFDILFTITFPAEPGTMDSVLVSIFDFTERKRSQRALERAQTNLAHVNRVSTLGELAASVAHEVSQPITAVVTSGEAALRWLALRPPNFDEVQQALERIVSEGKRAGEVLWRIRAMVKKAPVQKERLDINQAILEVVALTRSEVQRNEVTLHTQLQPALPLVQGDRIQLQQVVLNFLLNAVEALSGVDKNRRNVVISTANASDNVIVAVRDSGMGLNGENAEHLFQPFYTTKTSGMGMGLSICRSIIEGHGGSVCAEGNADAGATFQFTLPAHQAHQP